MDEVPPRRTPRSTRERVTPSHEGHDEPMVTMDQMTQNVVDVAVNPLTSSHHRSRIGAIPSKSPGPPAALRNKSQRVWRRLLRIRRVALGSAVTAD